MAVRSTMENLIGRVRGLINDPASNSQIFDDLDVQEALDRYRDDYRYLDLIDAVTFQGGPPTQTVWLDYYAPAGTGNWEDDLTLWSYNFTQLTPSASDNLTGHWTFDTNHYPPVFIIGKSYDIYAAAAMLLRKWAAKEMLNFDASLGRSQPIMRSQKFQMINQLADQYDGMRRVRVSRMTRDDTNSAGSSGVVGGRW